MKKLIILSAVVLFAAFLFLENNTSTVDVTNDFLLENVRALAYGGDGDGEIDPDPTDPDIPPRPVYSECYDKFDYKLDSKKGYRKCKKDEPQRAANSECVDQISYYEPTSMQVCIMPGTKPIDPQ